MADVRPSPHKAAGGKDRKDGNFNVQFINITDSLSMDKSSRTKVRVQVMREYHRKRLSNEKERFAAHMPEKPKPLTAKSQTQKFRLGQEKDMKPWVPVKMQTRKRQDPKEVKKRRKVSHDMWMEIDSSDIHGAEELPGGSLEQKGIYVSLNEGYQLPWSSFGDFDTTEALLPRLNFAIQNASLNQSSASNSLDPFSAMSLPITPRTQLLLHHYCK